MESATWLPEIEIHYATRRIEVLAKQMLITRWLRPGSPSIGQSYLYLQPFGRVLCRIVF